MSAGAHHSLALTAQSEVCVLLACDPAEGVWCYGMQMSSGMTTVDNIFKKQSLSDFLSRCFHGETTAVVSWDTWSPPALSPDWQR